MAEYRDVQCPICEDLFDWKVGSSKVTCGKPSCRSAFFSSGENHWNWKGGKDYRSLCFQVHGRQCLICGTEKNVDAHHIDENRNNDHYTNLIPLCRKHHKQVHSKNNRLPIIIEISLYMKNLKEMES